MPNSYITYFLECYEGMADENMVRVVIHKAKYNEPHSATYITTHIEETPKTIIEVDGVFIYKSKNEKDYSACVKRGSILANRLTVDRVTPLDVKRKWLNVYI